ncbi:hypothetical protein D3C87_1100300 [compost metagenome]
MARAGRHLDFSVGRQSIQHTFGEQQVGGAEWAGGTRHLQAGGSGIVFMSHHSRALGQLQPGLVFIRQTLGPGTTGLDENIDVIATEHFQVQFLFRVLGTAFVISTDMAYQIPGLDRHRLVERHHLIRQRCRLTLQRRGQHVLADAFQLAELAFTTDGDFCSLPQYEQITTVEIEAGPNIRMVTGRTDPIGHTADMLQVAEGNIALQRAIGVTQ